MYQAKRTNSAVTAYEPESDTADHAGLVVGGMLPRAVAEKEFTLEFQPIVDLLDAPRRSAAEALARWQHPDRGMVDPGSFLEPIETVRPADGVHRCRARPGARGGQAVAQGSGNRGRSR